MPAPDRPTGVAGALPWTPQAGQPTDPLQAEIVALRRRIDQMTAVSRFQRFNTIRRLLLVILLSCVGGMIGSAFTMWALAPYFQ